MRRVLDLVVVAVAMGVSGRADELPAGRAPRSHIQPVGELAAVQASPWAGLVTSRAPAVLREQFRLERGAGLVVDSVAEGSGASRAGLRQHDVLVSLDGQLLLLPEQFTALLEGSAADAALECRLFRGGVEQTISLKPAAPASRPATAAALKPAASTLDLLPRKPAVGVAMVTELPDGSLQHRDADYVVKLSPGPEPRLIVRDARGRIIFNGPCETPEQQSLVPPEVRSRVAGLERFRVRRLDRAGDATGGEASRPAARIGALDIDPVEIR